MGGCSEYLVTIKVKRWHWEGYMNGCSQYLVTDHLIPIITNLL